MKIDNDNLSSKTTNCKKYIIASLFLFLILIHFLLLNFTPICKSISDAVHGYLTQNPKKLYWGIGFQLENNPDKTLLGKIRSVEKAFIVHAQVRPFEPTNKNTVTEFWLNIYGAFLREMNIHYYPSVETHDYAYLNSSNYLFRTVKSDKETIENNALQVKTFSQELSLCKIPFVVVINPCKNHKLQPGLPRGVKSYGNENADCFIDLLRKYSIPYIDNRELFLNNPQKHYEYFYRTDHHWKTEYAFYAFVNVAQYLNSHYQFGFPEALFAIDNYDIVTRPYPFENQETLRRVGKWYILPEATRNYFVLKGHKTKPVTDDYYCYPPELYQDLEYVFNSDHIYGLRQIYNRNSTNPRKLLIIKDSFVEFQYQFFAQGCSQVDLIDCRNYKDRIIDYAKEFKPDMVLLIYNADFLHQPHMFRLDDYLPEDADYRR